MKPGDIVDGKYRIVRLMGEGGMGAVYEVHHEIVGGRFALKCLHPQHATNPEIVKRFIQEARAASAIGSEHIVMVTDGGQLETGAPYLVMEYLEGEDLASMLKREGRLDQARAVGLMLQVCEALTPAHERGIVHRDLKPGNLFLTQREKYGEWVKVLDFGIAKVRSGVAGRSASMTKTGATLGTPHYMAPEQFMKAKHVDHRADVYAAGVILYEMLAGCWPFDADSYEELIVAVATGAPQPLGEVFPDVNDELAGIVMRILSRNPADRFQTMRELATSLEVHAFTTPVVSVPPTVVSAPTRPSQDRIIPATREQRAGPIPLTSSSPVPTTASQPYSYVEDSDTLKPVEQPAVIVDPDASEDESDRITWESRPPRRASSAKGETRGHATGSRSRLWVWVAAISAIAVAGCFFAWAAISSQMGTNNDFQTEEPRTSDTIAIPAPTVSSGSTPDEVKTRARDLMEQNEFEAALGVLASLGPSSDPEVVRLRTKATLEQESRQLWNTACQEANENDVTGIYLTCKRIKAESRFYRRGCCEKAADRYGSKQIDEISGHIRGREYQQAVDLAKAVTDDLEISEGIRDDAERLSRRAKRRVKTSVVAVSPTHPETKVRDRGTPNESENTSDRSPGKILEKQPPPASDDAISSARSAYLRGDYSTCIRTLGHSGKSRPVVSVLIMCYQGAGKTSSACRLAKSHQQYPDAEQFYNRRCR